MTVFSMLETKVLYFYAPCYGFLINWIAKVQMKLTNKCNVMLITEWRLSHYSTIFSDNHSLLPLWYFEWWWLIEWISSLFWVHVEVLSGILVFIIMIGSYSFDINFDIVAISALIALYLLHSAWTLVTKKNKLNQTSEIIIQNITRCTHFIIISLCVLFGSGEFQDPWLEHK